MMLKFVTIKAFEEISADAGTFFGPAGPTEVGNLNVGKKRDLPTRVADSALPVGLLRIHEEPFVEPPYPLENLTSKQDARADDPLDVALPVVGPGAVITKHGMVGKHR